MKPDPWSVLSLKTIAIIDDLWSITSRRDNSKKHTFEVINRDYQKVFIEIFFSDHCADGSEYIRKKIDICRELMLDLMIEDCLEYAIEIAPVVRRVYLLDKPWNQCKRLPNKIIRIRGGWRGLHNSIIEFRKKL